MLFEVPLFTRLRERLDAHSVLNWWRESIRTITCRTTYLKKEGWGGESVGDYVDYVIPN